MEAGVHHGRGTTPAPAHAVHRRVGSSAGGDRGAKRRFRLPADAPVISCYEAGRDGFWIHRYLASLGVENLVVDSSSIEVNRRARRAKTDRMDVEKLLAMLLRY